MSHEHNSIIEEAVDWNNLTAKVSEKTICHFLFLVLSSIIHLKAQEDLDLTHRHELKLNFSSSVFMAFSEISYEYLLSEDMTVVTAVGFVFDTGNGDGYS